MRTLFMISLMAFGLPQIADANTPRSGGATAASNVQDGMQRGDRDARGQQGAHGTRDMAGHKGMQSRKHTSNMTGKNEKVRMHRRENNAVQPLWLGQSLPQKRNLRAKPPMMSQQPLSPRMLKRLKAAKRAQMAQKNGQKQRSGTDAMRTNRQKSEMKRQGHSGQGQKPGGANRHAEGKRQK